jgi:hypothetical protein
MTWTSLWIGKPVTRHAPVTGEIIFIEPSFVAVKILGFAFAPGNETRRKISGLFLDF